ncbi:MAG: helix-turn-helix transcriptional regulator [Anaerolineae bacterium]|nr:helix-turn-helix transcriptional regulator [Anaerolineae bacterium]
MTFIERLKHFREIWGWSQAFVAAMLRVSRKTVSNWERNQTVPLPDNQEKLEALVRMLEQASHFAAAAAPPQVELRTGGDSVGRDKTIGGDQVGRDKITTSDGTTYIIRDSVVIVAADPDQVKGILPPAGA